MKYQRQCDCGQMVSYQGAKADFGYQAEVTCPQCGQVYEGNLIGSTPLTKKEKSRFGWVLIALPLIVLVGIVVARSL